MSGVCAMALRPASPTLVRNQNAIYKDIRHYKIKFVKSWL